MPAEVFQPSRHGPSSPALPDWLIDDFDFDDQVVFTSSPPRGTTQAQQQNPDHQVTLGPLVGRRSPPQGLVLPRPSSPLFLPDLPALDREAEPQQGHSVDPFVLSEPEAPPHRYRNPLQISAGMRNVRGQVGEDIRRTVQLDSISSQLLRDGPDLTHIRQASTSAPIDLTDTTTHTSSMPPSRKRKAHGSGAAATSRKSARTVESFSNLRPAGSSSATVVDDCEIVDLVDALDEHDLARIEKRKMEETRKQENIQQATKPLQLSRLDCPICMDTMSDMTVTHCGHLFCGECLHHALQAGVTRKMCPVCRSPIDTAIGKNKKGIFLLEMKVMTRSKQGKQPLRS